MKGGADRVKRALRRTACRKENDENMESEVN